MNEEFYRLEDAMTIWLREKAYKQRRKELWRPSAACKYPARKRSRLSKFSESDRFVGKPIHWTEPVFHSSQNTVNRTVPFRGETYDGVSGLIGVY